MGEGGLRGVGPNSLSPWFVFFEGFPKPLIPIQEFWFTAGATFFYFTAFVSILVGFVDWEYEEYQYWVDANIAAGVSQSSRITSTST